MSTTIDAEGNEVEITQPNSIKFWDRPNLLPKQPSCDQCFQTLTKPKAWMLKLLKVDKNTLPKDVLGCENCGVLFVPIQEEKTRKARAVSK